ncbi:MAG TPA: hypothetical protein VD867_07840 [Burkholderiales bacterium]|nr:hypothetical protein [Burkholderiales bacterium]
MTAKIAMIQKHAMISAGTIDGDIETINALRPTLSQPSRRIFSALRLTSKSSDEPMDDGPGGGSELL